ncbi:MAG: SAF domain-containing protein [Pseudomonadota bacterium]
MQIVDTALAQRAQNRQPLQVGVFGAGAMARGFINQIMRYMPGMSVGVLCNRTIETARNVLNEAGVSDSDIVEVGTAEQADAAIEAGKTAITSDPNVLAGAGRVEVCIEATGHVEYGAQVTLATIEHGKSMVYMNAELDGTIGPLLKKKADAAGVILSGCDGDQPGVVLNLHRFVTSIGMVPRVLGNIKGMQDRYRNPTTQAAFAKQWQQTPHMVTSFADGTKISFEQAITANATGMKVAQRGMIGIEYDGHVDEMTNMYDLDQIRELGGIVDYVIGTKPSPGVFIFAEAQDDLQKHYMKYSKLGDGPLYSFYVPYHLMVFEVPLSAARIALCNDVIIAPQDGPMVDVIALAKTDLKAGETLDGLGWYMTYGVCENYETVRKDRLLPMGIAEGAVLTRDVKKDQALTYDDVILPTNLTNKLRAEQDALFPI